MLSTKLFFVAAAASCVLALPIRPVDQGLMSRETQRDLFYRDVEAILEAVLQARGVVDEHKVPAPGGGTRTIEVDHGSSNDAKSSKGLGDAVPKSVDKGTKLPKSSLPSVKEV